MHLTNAIRNAQFFDPQITAAHFTAADFTDPTKKWLPNFPVAQFSVYLQIRYSIFGAHLVQPSELHKVKHLLFCGSQEPQRGSRNLWLQWGRVLGQTF